MRAGALRTRRPSARQAIPVLIGAEATILLVWHASGFQYAPVTRDIDELTSVLLGIAPFLTILVALVFGWIDRRPTPTLALVGLTLVGPTLIAIHVSVSPHSPQEPGGLLAAPACTAAGVRMHRRWSQPRGPQGTVQGWRAVLTDRPIRDHRHGDPFGATNPPKGPERISMMPHLTRTTSRSRRRPRSRGQSLVEFALVLPIFLLILCAIMDFGFLLYSRITVINAAREGARVAMTMAEDQNGIGGAVSDRVSAAAAGLAVTTATCRVPKGSNNCSAFVTVTPPATPPPGDSVRVTVSYEHRLFFPLLFGTEIPMSSTVQMVLE